MRPPLSRRPRAMLLNVHNQPESMSGCANCCKMCCGYTAPAIILLLSVALGGASEAYYIYLIVQYPFSGWRVFLCVLFSLLCPVVTGAILWAFHRVIFTSPGYVPPYPWRYVPHVSPGCLQRMARNPQALALYTQQQQQLRQFQQQLLTTNNNNVSSTTVIMAASALGPTNTMNAVATSADHPESALNINTGDVQASQWMPNTTSHSPLCSREGQAQGEMHHSNPSPTTMTTNSSSSSSTSNSSSTTSATHSNEDNIHTVTVPVDQPSLTRRCIEHDGEVTYVHNSPTAPSQPTLSTSCAKPSPSISVNNPAASTTTTTTTTTTTGALVNEQPELPLNPYVVTQLDRYYQLRFCRICNQYKPDDAHHCSICQRCVYNFDHHCPFINNCVGRNNYLLFIVFLLYSSVGCLFIMVMDFIALFAVDTQEVFDKIGWIAMPIMLAALGIGLLIFYFQHRMMLAEGKSTLDSLTSHNESRSAKEECTACLSRTRGHKAHVSEEQKMLQRQAKAERIAAHRRAVLGVGGPWWKMYVPVPVRTDTRADEVIV